jgi:hypothetical protein
VPIDPGLYDELAGLAQRFGLTFQYNKTTGKKEERKRGYA